MTSIDHQGYQAAMEVRFRRAARHSRNVRLLRKAIPAVVVLSLAGVFAVSLLNPFRLLAKLPLSVGNLAVSGTKITMQSPHLTGFTPDHRPYDLRARTATQDVTDPIHVELQDLKANVQMEDNTTVEMDADVGNFDTKAQTLDLRKKIFLQSSSGYEARLTQALVDFGKGTITSDEPVAVKLLQGTLDANRLRIIENGALVVFYGGVKMNLVLEGPPPAEPANAAPAAAPAPDPAAEAAGGTRVTPARRRSVTRIPE